MRSNIDLFDFEAARREGEDPGSFLGLALLALAVGAGSALLFAPVEGARTRKVVRGRLRELRGGAGHALERLQRELKRREARRLRRERRSSALIGVAIGAGLAALLTPATGSETRRRIVDTVRRGKDQATRSAERVVREPQPDPEPAA